MPRARENPYLAWLDMGAAPPFPGSLKAYRAASTELLRRLRLSIQRFRHLTARPALAEYENAQKHHHAAAVLVRWGQVVESNQPQPRQWRAAADALDETLLRLDAQFIQPDLRKTLRHILCLKGLTARQRYLVRSGLIKPNSDKALAAARRVRALEAEHDARSLARSSRPMAYEKLWVKSSASLVDLTASCRRKGAEAARAEGHEKGYLFFAHSEGMNVLRSYACDPMLRRAAWAAEAHSASTVDHIETMRRARHEEAVEGGYANTLALVMSSTAVRTPRRIERLMELGLDSHRAAARQVERRQVARARRKYRMDFDPSWDQTFLDGSVPIARSLDVTADVFPWKETAARAVSEVVGIMGWRLMGQPEMLPGGVSTTVCFNLSHEKGGTARIFYTPFDPVEREQSYAAASAIPVRLRGIGEGAQVAWIRQALDPSFGGFTLSSLSHFVHELGHVLHHFTLEGAYPDEADGIPADIIELPAVLLQQYVRDPEVLIRWSSAPKARRSTYWTRRLALSGNDVLVMRENLAKAYVDFLAHRHAPAKLGYEELARRSFERAGLPLAPDGGRHQFEQSFTWRNDYAASESTHVLASALVHRLVVHRADGQMSASDIASAYRELCDRVLANGTDDNRFRRLWRSWLGEGVAASMSRGMNTMARYHRRLAATA